MSNILEEFKELHSERVELANWQLYFMENHEYSSALTAQNRMKIKNVKIEMLLKSAVEKENDK